MNNYIENTLTAADKRASLLELSEGLEKLEKRVFMKRSITFLKISRQQVYNLLNGKSQLSLEAALFFAKYFDVEPTSLVPSDRIDLINQLTRIREEKPEYKAPKMKAVKGGNK